MQNHMKLTALTDRIYRNFSVNSTSGDYFKHLGNIFDKKTTIVGVDSWKDSKNPSDGDVFLSGYFTSCTCVLYVEKDDDGKIKNIRIGHYSHETVQIIDDPDNYDWKDKDNIHAIFFVPDGTCGIIANEYYRRGIFNFTVLPYDATSRPSFFPALVVTAVKYDDGINNGKTTIHWNTYGTQSRSGKIIIL
jgi:hypothetical protein